LVKVALSYAPKLCDLKGLDQLPFLDELEFDKCIHAELLPIVGTLKTLRILRLLACGSLPSLKFLRNLPKLEDFSFVGTHVTDGDLLPLLGLKWAGFSNKKHHSHTRKQIDALLAAKAAGKNIP
jgi:protein phosphatase 1 regulatory subunit 7